MTQDVGMVFRRGRWSGAAQASIVELTRILRWNPKKKTLAENIHRLQLDKQDYFGHEM